MPLIEYQCPNCNKIEEKIVRINERIPDHYYNTCCYVKSKRIISVPAKRRDMTVIGDNKL